MPDDTSAPDSNGPTRLTVETGVATITLDDPERRNSLSNALVNSLGDNLRAAIDDEAVRAIVLTNTSSVFCPGANLKGGEDEDPRHSLVDLFGFITGSPKPVVGRIAGHCMGGGVGLAAACDISVVTEEAMFGFTEVRIGVAPAIISVVCLPKMSRGDAMELFLSGERVSAARAGEVGLVNHVVPAAEVDATVDDILAKITAGGPNALAAAKELINKVPSMDVDDAYAWTGPLSAELFASDEAAEGIAAFREKRPATWVPND